MTDKQLLAKLRSALDQERIETPESGYFTRDQWAARFGIRKTACWELIDEARKCGKVDIKSFRIQNGKRIQPTPHYKFIV